MACGRNWRYTICGVSRLIIQPNQSIATRTRKETNCHGRIEAWHCQKTSFTFSRQFSTNHRPVVTSTVDDEEHIKFTKLSQLWWDETGEFRALHTMNNVRVPLIRDALENYGNTSPQNSGLPLDNLKILDVGCGGGILTEPLARLGAFCLGVDMVEENIKIAQKHLESDPNIQPKIKYIQASIEDLVGTEEESFDAVVASEVVEHVSDLQSFISSCAHLLKPGGSLFITTLNKTLLSKILGVYVAEYVAGIVPKGTHDWEKFVEPDVLKYELECNGLQIKLIHGLGYNPITNSWCWSKDTSINYAVHALKTVKDQ